MEKQVKIKFGETSIVCNVADETTPMNHESAGWVQAINSEGDMSCLSEEARLFLAAPIFEVSGIINSIEHIDGLNKVSITAQLGTCTIKFLGSLPNFVLPGETVAVILLKDIDGGLVAEIRHENKK